MKDGKITVAILDDLEDVAKTLQELLNEEPDMLCTQIYLNAEDAMHFFPLSPCDILIVDIGLPRASGIEAIKHISVECPGTEFCMFTVYEEDDKIFESLKSGAKGYILKSSKPESIASSIRELISGGSPMSPSIARRIIDIFQNMKITPLTYALPLTDRELQLLDLLSKGLLYKEIADEMKITLGTVKQHIHKIYEKLHVSNKTEAINRYLNNNQD